MRPVSSAYPPDWLVAPHLRRRDAHGATAGDDKGWQPPPSERFRQTRVWRMPFPDWRDGAGFPLAALLGPPCWRDVPLPDV